METKAATESHGVYHDESGSTSADKMDMYRMGKTQELKRNFRPVTMVAFAMILLSSWEIILSSATTNLVDGGTAGVVWMYLIVWFTFIAIYASCSEMGSMAPTSGGMYHWVSEFAPRKYQKVLSYIVGWLSVTGWQTGAAGSAFLAGTQIQGLLVLNYDWYEFQRWHGTLLAIAIASFATIFNTLFARHLPKIEGIILVLHICDFVGILAVLWIIPRHASASSVFLEFSNPGWISNGVSALAGASGSIYTLLGGDAAAHMSEELEDASKSLPQAIMYTVVLNGAMGFVMAVTYLFCIDDLQVALESPTGYAFIQVFYDSTGSLAATNAMVAIIIVLICFSAVTAVSSASRQLFAFARDHALPLSPWIASVNPTLNVPVNAILVSLGFTTILCIINIGSTVAYQSISSLGVGALLLSYMVSISCLIWRKVTRKPLLPSRFDLGKLGLALNVIAVCFCSVLLVFSFFPPFSLPTLETETMNWSSLMFGSVCIWSAVYYIVWGRFHYDGPVEYVRKLD